MKNILNIPGTALIPDVKFRIRIKGEKIRAGRNLVVISTFNRTHSQLEELREAYFKDLLPHISFPIKERARHLKVRIHDELFGFSRYVISFFPKFIFEKFRVPSKKIIEVVIHLNEIESKNLLQYIENIKKRRSKVIGGFSHRGSQYSEGKLDANRVINGKNHNCTSWISTAPIGEKGESLLELVGGDKGLEVATNPGWWSSWLSASADLYRVPFVIFWTPEPLDHVLKSIKSGANFPWDFNRF